ncbi:MAG: hypothetical protein HYR96_14895 [Deltaproteobacteria bacterium]|nr:hypothetical protein [Deltaproteobacteria bacterium]MBI3293657.1 hypothetical protein [Deltaproteobacteria bacterium]
MGNRGTILFIASLFLTLSIEARAGITVHAAEVGVAKFHRHDNSVHPYSSDNIWAAFIAPDEFKFESVPFTRKNSNGSYTIIFATLEDLAQSMIKVAHEAQDTIDVFNINGHGAPGVMWFPKDQKTMNSFSCSDWVEAAKGGDEANYNQYYSAVSKEDIMMIRYFAEQISATIPCTVGLKEWQAAAQKFPDLKNIFSDNGVAHFVSCTVGLGKRGDSFSKGMASVFFHSSKGRVETSLPLGLGDWSMPEGMGFWDYLTDEQLEHDNKIYVENKRDRDIMQKGSVRVGYLAGLRGEESAIVANRDFMFLDGHETHDILVPWVPARTSNSIRPMRVRIPGTKVHAAVSYR